MDGHVGSLAAEWARLADALTDRLTAVGERARTAARDAAGRAPGACAECGRAPGAAPSCDGCPWCETRAVLRGERPETVAALADTAVAVLCALRGTPRAAEGDGDDPARDEGR